MARKVLLSYKDADKQVLLSVCNHLANKAGKELYISTLIAPSINPSKAQGKTLHITSALKAC